MDDEFARHKKAYDNQEKLEAIEKIIDKVWIPNQIQTFDDGSEGRRDLPRQGADVLLMPKALLLIKEILEK